LWDGGWVESYKSVSLGKPCQKNPGLCISPRRPPPSWGWSGGYGAPGGRPGHLGRMVEPLVVSRRVSRQGHNPLDCSMNPLMLVLSQNIITPPPTRGPRPPGRSRPATRGVGVNRVRSSDLDGQAPLGPNLHPHLAGCHLSPNGPPSHEDAPSSTRRAWAGGSPLPRLIEPPEPPQMSHLSTTGPNLSSNCSTIGHSLLARDSPLG
jgi:hypothetical protein